MAIQLDEDFLNDIGLGNASPEKKKAFVEQILEVLQMRVGDRLGEDLTEEQLSDFERVVGAAEDSGLAAEEWLKANNPRYEEIISEELAILGRELRADIDTVVAQ